MKNFVKTLDLEPVDIREIDEASMMYTVNETEPDEEGILVT